MLVSLPDDGRETGEREEKDATKGGRERNIQLNEAIWGGLSPYLCSLILFLYLIVVL